MNVDKFEVFVKCAGRYFAEMTDTPAQVSPPFLKEDFKLVGDYTGTIGLTGDERGCVCLTVTRPFLIEILSQLGEESPAEELVADLVGEMTNIISGNAREVLGAGFMISVPVVVSGNPSDISLPGDVITFLVPIKWKQHTAYLSISVERTSSLTK